MKCRARAQSVVGVTAAQRSGLALGASLGGKTRLGYVHSEETKQKVSTKNRAFWAANPEKALARGANNRGEKAYNWKGGITKLSVSIRQMAEMIKWQRAVKARDGACVQCGSTYNLEAHHIRPFAQLMADLDIRNRDDARRQSAVLFDIANGKTLCETCHYTEHGRTAPPSDYREEKFRACRQCGARFAAKPSQKDKCCSRECSLAWRKANPLRGPLNHNWEGGGVSFNCVECGIIKTIKRAHLKRRRAQVCSKECSNANRRKRLQPYAAAPSSAIHQGCESG